LPLPFQLQEDQYNWDLQENWDGLWFAVGLGDRKMTARNGDVVVYPPIRPDMPYIVIRFAGYGLQMAGVAKSEQAARSMLRAHEESAAKQAPSQPESGPAGSQQAK
jgi:hypothetical protein